jgi:hypothetical protein
MSMRLRLILTTAACVVALLVVAVVAALQPRVQNHFGYALPGENRLPLYVYYNDRRYADPNGTCWSAAYLQQVGIWPLHQVGEMPTLFGAVHIILDGPTPAGFTTTLLFVPSGRCYVVYALEGGP